MTYTWPRLSSVVAFSLGAFLLLASARAYDVTSTDARKATLLDYIQSRSDLSAANKREWDKALRFTFGGKAIKDGTDEGVTVAKSVIAAALFHRIEPKQAAKAAYAAYHDTYRWIPPPIAINYQILAMQGRKPKADPRELAYNFPRYFNEEIAPDLAAWWDDMLAKGQIPDYERGAVETALQKTRELMRPMLLERLWQGAELEARRINTDDAKIQRTLDAELSELRQELARDYKGVGQNPAVGDVGKSFYERYAALAKETGQTSRPKPAVRIAQTPPALAKPAPPPPVKPEPAAPTRDAFAPVAPAKPDEPRVAKPADSKAIPAPMPGDPLLVPFAGWFDALQATVKNWLGTPYLFGGMDRRGIDCSAFVRTSFLESMSVELPRNSRAQYLLGTQVDQNSLKPGDLVFFDTMDRGRVTHVGLYLGAGKFAHASSSKGVTQANLPEAYYQRAFVGAKRILAP